jgi:poly(A) polymerase
MATLRKGDELSLDYASLMPSFDPLLDAYGSLEARIAVLREHEELAAIRPSFDGEQIMAILDVPAGPLVGRTYKFLLELRPDRGPLDEAEARAALLEWWATQPR